MVEVLIMMAIVAAILVVLHCFRTRYLIVSSGQPACGLPRSCPTCGVCHERASDTSASGRAIAEVMRRS